MHRRLRTAVIAGVAVLALTGCAGASPEQQAVDVTTEWVDAASSGDATSYCDKESSFAVDGEWSDIKVGHAEEVEDSGTYELPVSWSIDGEAYDEIFTVQQTDSGMCVVTRVAR